MPRYYREADGMEPRLTFRLASGWEMTVLLPISEKWEEELVKMMQTRPEVVSAKINSWNGELIVDLQKQSQAPHTVKPMRGILE